MGEVLDLVLEHELMHHETLMYMIAQLDADRLVKPADWVPPVPGGDVVRERREVAPGMVQLGAERGSLPFGWDNEFPAEHARVPGFAIDSVPVTIGAYRRFVDAGGYHDPQWWREGDFTWVQRQGLKQPLAWVARDGGTMVRSMFTEHPIDEVAGWPVYVSYAEACAFAAWSGSRLPTEAELHRAAYTGPGKGAGRRGSDRARTSGCTAGCRSTTGQRVPGGSKT